MKKQTLLCITLSLLVGIISIACSAQEMPSIKVNVPFAFNFDNRPYPSGEYTFSAMKDNFVLLQRTEYTDPVVVMADTITNPLAGQNAGAASFQCYDGECFLAQLRIPGHDGQFQIRRSRTETQIAGKTTLYLTKMVTTTRQ